MTEEVQTDWRDSLPEAIKESPYFGEGRSPEEVAADIKNAAAWQGNSIRIPGPDATPEQREEMVGKVVEKFGDLMKVPDVLNEDSVNAALLKLGKPEEASKYTVPEGIDVPPELKNQAFEAGLTQKQFEKLVKTQYDQGLEHQATIDARLQEQEDVLKADWGAAIEDRKAVVAEYLAGDGVPAALREAYATNGLDAETIKWIYSQAEASEESRTVTQQNDGRSGAMTPLEATHQLQEVWKRLSEMRPSDPGYNELLQQKTKLTRLKLGG